MALPFIITLKVLKLEVSMSLFLWRSKAYWGKSCHFLRLLRLLTIHELKNIFLISILDPNGTAMCGNKSLVVTVSGWFPFLRMGGCCHFKKSTFVQIISLYTSKRSYNMLNGSILCKRRQGR